MLGRVFSALSYVLHGCTAAGQCSGVCPQTVSSVSMSRRELHREQQNERKVSPLRSLLSFLTHNVKKVEWPKNLTLKMCNNGGRVILEPELLMQ